MRVRLSDSRVACHGFRETASPQRAAARRGAAETFNERTIATATPKTVRHAECKNGDHRTGGADSRMLQVELDLLFFVVPDVLCSPCINRQPSRLDAALAGIADMRVGCYEECKKLFCSEAWS